jgi:CRISPR-associated protein Cas2
MTHYVISYDVGTETAAGRRRLRRIAKLCSSFGQRVQLSVFECTLDDLQFDRLMAAAAGIIDRGEDSLRAYRLHGERTGAVAVLGQDRSVDFNAPLNR